MKNKKSSITEIYRIANKLGLQRNEVYLISNSETENKQIFLETGPPLYPGTHYGTISINDF
jgi:hypothetical protein